MSERACPPCVNSNVCQAMDRCMYKASRPEPPELQPTRYPRAAEVLRHGAVLARQAAATSREAARRHPHHEAYAKAHDAEAAELEAAAALLDGEP